MKTKIDRIVQHTKEFDAALVALLVKNLNNLDNNDEQLWGRVASGIFEVSGKSIAWKELRQYYKFYVVTKLKNLINDQQLIDRLQYPWLEKVYKVRVLYNFVGSIQSDPLIEARNKLLIKYAIDNRYDAKIVSTFKRLHNPQLLNKISINVENPAYELTKDLQLFLLKPLELRSRERLGKRFSSKIAKLPCYLQPAVTGQQRNHQHSVAVSTSPILLDNASVCIEEASLSNTCNSVEFSPRDLLEKESLNIQTQEFLCMQQLGEVEVAEQDSTRAHGNRTMNRITSETRSCVGLSSSNESAKNVYWQPEEYANLVPDINSIFSDDDEEDEEEEEEAGGGNEKNASGISAEKENLYWQPEEYANLVPDVNSIFSDEDEEDEEEDEEAGGENEKNASGTSAEKGVENDDEQPTAASDCNGPSAGSTQSEDNCPNIISSSSGPEKNENRRTEQFSLLLSASIFSDEDEEEVEEEEVGRNEKKLSDNSGEKVVGNGHEQATAASDYNDPSAASIASEEVRRTDENTTDNDVTVYNPPEQVFVNENHEVTTAQQAQTTDAAHCNRSIAEITHSLTTDRVFISVYNELAFLTGEHNEQPDQTVKQSTSSDLGRSSPRLNASEKLCLIPDLVTELEAESDPLSENLAPINKSAEENVSCCQRTASLSSNSESSSSNTMNTIIFHAGLHSPEFASTSPEEAYTTGRKQKRVQNATFPQCSVKRRKRAFSSYNAMVAEDQDAKRNLSSETARSADLEAMENSPNNLICGEQLALAGTIDEHSYVVERNPAQDPAVLVSSDAIVIVQTADRAPLALISPLAADRLARISSKLDAVLTQKLAIVQTLRVTEPALFFRPASTVQQQLKISHQLIVLQLLASAMQLLYGEVTHLLPILNRIAYGDFAHPTR